MSEILQPISDDDFRALEHPLQSRRFALALFFALLLFPLIAICLAAGTVVLIVPLIALLLWVSGRIMFAYFMGNCILVSDLNYPRIHRIGEELKATIGYHKTINIFVYEQGHFNAYLMKFFFYRRAVFLNSELLEAGVTDDELRWLIGRFVGYLRARRRAGFWGWAIRAAQHLLIFNFFLLPYERTLVFTGDRIALAVINGNLSSSISAMQKILVGRQLGYSVNPNGIVDQHRLVKGSFFAFCARMWMAFPHMTARYVDLIGFAKLTFPVQFARFDAENPGLPTDLPQLAALPQTAPLKPAKYPVWAGLGGAVAVLAVVWFLSAKTLWPELTSLYPNLSRGTTPTYAAPPGDSSQIGIPTRQATPVLQATPVSDTATDTTPAARVTPATLEAAQPEPAANNAERGFYVSEAGRFKVLFPGNPTQGTQQVTLAGTDSTTIHQFHFEDNTSSFMVMYNDYPEKYVPSDPQAILTRVRDGATQSFKAALVSDGLRELANVPGRAFRLSGKDGSTCYVRDFLDGQRLYQVMVYSSTGSAAPQAAEDFLNSFSIMDHSGN